MMRTPLGIALVLEVASGGFRTISLAMMKAPGLEVLGLFVLVYAVEVVCFVIGVWAHWRRPELRRTAIWVLALPFVFLVLPGIVKYLAGGRLTEGGLAALLLTVLPVILLACLVMPRKVAGKLPGFRVAAN